MAIPYSAKRSPENPWNGELRPNHLDGYGSRMPIHSDGYSDPGFRTTISYIDRSRQYYAAKGFDVPYRWAKHRTAPFSPLSKPLAEANIALVTTAKLHGSTDDTAGQEDKAARQTRFQPFAVSAEEVPPLSTSDLFWHKSATHTDDRETFLPLAALQRMASGGSIGRVNDRIFGVPTVYSHRRTNSFADMVSAWCAEDDVDVALLVPI